MTLLITQEEVIRLSFEDKNFNKAKIKDAVILTAQYNWLRPVLGDAFYISLLNEIANDGLNQNNAFLLEDYIKPCLAYYVKFTVATDLMLEMTNKGGQKGNSDFSETITAEERGEKRNAAKATADTLRKILIDFLNKANKSYPNYQKSKVKKAVRGGFLLGSRRGIKQSDEVSFIDTSNTKTYYYQADENGYFSIDFEDIKAVGEQILTVIINAQGQIIDSNDYEFNSVSENQILEVWLLTDNEIDKTGKITITVSR